MLSMMHSHLDCHSMWTAAHRADRQAGRQAEHHAPTAIVLAQQQVTMPHLELAQLKLAASAQLANAQATKHKST
jgi:hypothetical protein